MDVLNTSGCEPLGPRDCVVQNAVGSYECSAFQLACSYLPPDLHESFVPDLFGRLNVVRNGRLNFFLLGWVGLPLLGPAADGGLGNPCVLCGAPVVPVVRSECDVHLRFLGVCVRLSC